MHGERAKPVGTCLSCRWDVPAVAAGKDKVYIFHVSPMCTSTWGRNTNVYFTTNHCCLDYRRSRYDLGDGIRLLLVSVRTTLQRGMPALRQTCHTKRHRTRRAMRRLLEALACAVLCCAVLCCANTGKPPCGGYGCASAPFTTVFHLFRYRLPFISPVFYTTRGKP